VNGDIIDMFVHSQPHHFPPLPDSFTSHADYLQKWERLFLYETFTSIVNSKRGIEEPGQKRKKDYSWTGYLIKGTEDQSFITARLYDRVPTLCNQEEGIEAYSPIKGVKESDILLISGEDLLNSANNHGKKANDIKKVLNPVWLKSNLMKPNVMLAYVEEKTKKGRIFVELKFDRTKATFVKSSDQAKGGYLQVHVYLLESLATNIREYKTLRMSEFYGLADTIVNPKKSLTIAAQSD
jgi:hypothetical protein